MNNRKCYSQRETKTPIQDLSKFRTRSTHPERTYTHARTASCAAASNSCVSDKSDGERCWHVTHITHTELRTDAYLGVCVCVQVMEELKVTAAASWRRMRLDRFIVPGSLILTSYTESLLHCYNLRSFFSIVTRKFTETQIPQPSSSHDTASRMSVSWILLNESFLQGNRGSFWGCNHKWPEAKALRRQWCFWDLLETHRHSHDLLLVPSHTVAQHWQSQPGGIFPNKSI